MKIERTHLKLYVKDNKYIYKKFNTIDKSFFIFNCSINNREIERAWKKSFINEYKHTEGSIDYKNCMIIQEENFLEKIKSVNS